MSVFRSNENRIGKIIYGALQVSVLVITILTFKPDSPHLHDDLTTLGLLFLMVLMSLPISFVAAPISFGLSFIIVGGFSFIVGQFTNIRNLSSFPATAFIILSWLGIFYAGYWQWFRFPYWMKRRSKQNDCRT